MLIDQYVGSNIHKYRIAHGYTLEALAKKIHKSKSTLSKYEKGLISLDVNTIGELAAVFRILPAHLLAIPENGETLPTDGSTFLSRQYMYSYDGQSKRVLNSIIERFQSLESDQNSIQLFYDVQDIDNPGKCKTIYSGFSKKFELLENYNLQNQKNTMEQIWLCSINGLNQSNSQIGILSGLLSSTMLPCARKILISTDIIKDKNLPPELILSKEDFKIFRKYNLFTLNQFME